MNEKQLYQQKRQAQLDEWQADLDKFKAKASGASADAQLRLNAQIKVLEGKIEEGKDNLLNTLTQFWRKFEKDLKKAQAEMKDIKAMEEKTDEVCDKCGSPMVIKSANT